MISNNERRMGRLQSLRNTQIRVLVANRSTASTVSVDARAYVKRNAANCEKNHFRRK
jgi:hypothetical protein